MPSRVRGARTITRKGLLTSNCGTEGTLGELIVAADLMRRGYQVFRAISPSCDYDLIILKGTHLLKVEVTKGYRDKGVLRWPKHYKAYDVLAVWEINSTITYIPELPLETQGK